MNNLTGMIDYKKLDGLLSSGCDLFFSAKPYEHLVVDDFLLGDAYSAVIDALPEPSASQRSSDYIFAKNKFENPVFDSSNKLLRDLRQELIGDRFKIFLSAIYGKDVFVDQDFVGGGLHQGGVGSYLDMHADFSRHPVNSEWVRELNILLYLNKVYDESWGGHLEMRNPLTNAVGRVAPIGNRLVIMLTKEHTLHGYKPISFPSRHYRTLIAAYAYSVNEDFDEIPDRSTLWKPQNSGGLKQFAAKIMPSMVSFKRKLFGSSTAKRAKR